MIKGKLKLVSQILFTHYKSDTSYGGKFKILYPPTAQLDLKLVNKICDTNFYFPFIIQELAFSSVELYAIEL